MAEHRLKSKHTLFHVLMVSVKFPANAVVCTINEMDRGVLEEINPSNWQLEFISTRIRLNPLMSATDIERTYHLCLKK